jgi:predicted small lipoprotein YifL
MLGAFPLIAMKPPRARLKLAPLAVVLLALAACGRAGPLEPPPDASALAKPSDSGSGDPQVRKKIPPITPPKTPFVLDPLL